MNYQDETYTRKIHLYLSGEMSEKDRIEFEKLIQLDDSLLDEVEFQRGLTLFMQDDEASQMKEQIRKIRDDQEKSSSFPWVKAIAAIAVITILSIPAYFLLRNNTLEAVQLSSKYYEKYPDYYTQMGGNNDSLTIVAMSLYNSEKYDEAIYLFKTIPSDSTGQISLYLSLCQLQSNKISESISTLKSKQKQLDSQNELNPIFQWYLVLAHLKANDPDQAKAELREFFRKGYRYKLDKAQELANELDIDY